MQQELDPTAVAIHYKVMADFFEARAKALLDQVMKLERELEALKNGD